MTEKYNKKNQTLFQSVSNNCIAVVIPCYYVKNHILDVIAKIGSEVSLIYVIDDKCPDKSGKYVEANCRDLRVEVLYHEVNQGVGGAVMTGYRAAVVNGADVIVKLDGDGQMDPRLISSFAGPILAGEADYTKGNRFFDLEKIQTMPGIRMFGNACLSLMTKFSSGYWNLMDPTNGYTAIHADIVQLLPLNKISSRYFFETDILFRLNTIRAVVLDIPMNANYCEEVSNMKIHKIIGEFFIKHTRNFIKRIFYNYYLRDLSIASLELPLGLLLLLGGFFFGGYSWIMSGLENTPTPIGTVMLAVLPILMGLQLIMAFVGYDTTSVPRNPMHRRFFL